MTAGPVILIVDDEPVNIQIMAAALQGDYDICFACNGADALRLAAQNQPALILLDVIMPGQDGYEVCRQLKDDPALCDIPVIFTTARDGVDDELRGLSAGAIDYMTKPIRPQLLRRRVENHVAMKHLRDQLTLQTLTDPLTGIGNRRQLDSRLPTEIRRLSREQGWLSLIMVDIDFFKQFNDNYGHPAGDDCLRRVGQAMASALNRASDLVVRYGGEEFACLLPGADTVSARLVGENLRRRVEDLAILPANPTHAGAGPDPVVRVTISVGIASGRCDPDLLPSLWIAEADRMLYLSKSQGRNRVTLGVLEPDGSEAVPHQDMSRLHDGAARA